MKSFVQVVLGQIISLFGNAALRFVLPLVLLRQTGSAAVYGAVTALALLSALAGTLVGGVLADRCRKARLMSAFDLAAAGLALGAAAVAGNLPVALWIPAVTVGIPVVIVQYLGCSDAVLGVVQAVLSVGGLVGGALAARSRNPLSDRHAVGLLLGIAVLCAGVVSGVLVGAAMRRIWTACPR